MNRAERRKAAKEGKVVNAPAVYHLTQEQIDKMKADAKAEGFTMALSIPVMVLHDKFGFGNIRATRFMDYAMIWFEAVVKGETPLTEIMKIAEDLTGVRFIVDSIPDRK